MTLGQRRARTRLGDLSVQHAKDPAKGNHSCETFEEAPEPRPTNHASPIRSQLMPTKKVFPKDGPGNST